MKDECRGRITYRHVNDALTAKREGNWEAYWLCVACGGFHVGMSGAVPEAKQKMKEKPGVFIVMGCQKDEHNFLPVAAQYQKLDGTGVERRTLPGGKCVEGPTYEEKIWYTTVCCTRCGEALEVISADHRALKPTTAYPTTTDRAKGE